jgi:hypothetical protein
MNRDQEEEIVRTNLASRLLLMRTDICRMLESATDAVLAFRREPIELDTRDLATLAVAKERIGELLVMIRTKKVEATGLFISEICQCPIHIKHLHLAGIRRLYHLMEADVLQVKYLLAEAEKDGAKRLYHLHALLHSSVRQH